MTDIEIRRTSLTQKSDWIQTFTGRKFWPIEPAAEDVCIEDIAHALALKCRFAGHCREFYSVAQHSVLVASLVQPVDALWALLHDAGEAYFADIPRPVKRSLPIFKDIERGIMNVVCEAFGLPQEQPQSVTHADAVLLATEARDLMGDVQHWTGLEAAPMRQQIVPLGWREAEKTFLFAFERFFVAKPAFPETGGQCDRH